MKDKFLLKYNFIFFLLLNNLTSSLNLNYLKILYFLIWLDIELYNINFKIFFKKFFFFFFYFVSLKKLLKIDFLLSKNIYDYNYLFFSLKNKNYITLSSLKFLN